MNGIIVVNKPKGKTSHDIVYIMRRLTGVRRVGHTGTLDPNATGVLPICIGNATKAAEYITDGNKAYRAEMILGTSTTTQDSSGEIVARKSVDIDNAQIVNVVNSFVGAIKQVPPMYSAVKVNGKKLYELARAGQEIERKSRTIEIFGIDILSVDLKNNVVNMDIACSKGTYIRTLCHDIGNKLGCFAHMGELQRLKSGRFDIEQSYTIEELTELSQKSEINNVLISTDEIFANYMRIDVYGEDERKIKNGVTLGYSGESGLYRVYGTDGEFLCVSEAGNGILKMIKSFWC